MCIANQRRNSISQLYRMNTGEYSDHFVHCKSLFEGKQKTNVYRHNKFEISSETFLNIFCDNSTISTTFAL